MQNPFPGMDPWMELRWRDMHARFVVYIADQLQEQLPEPLVARVEEMVVEGEDFPPKESDPDLVSEPEVDRYIEIIDTASADRAMTAVKPLTPANKLPGEGRKAYRSKQRAFINAGVNLVEIDLMRRGEWALSIDEAAMPRNLRTPYMACVFRATRPASRALYCFPLRKSLPKIAIPLCPHDRDVALDLQQVVNQAYDAGRYDRIDHTRPLDPPLRADDAAWAAELLRKAGRLS